MKTLILGMISLGLSSAFADTINLTTGETYQFGNKTISCNANDTKNLPVCIIVPGIQMLYVGCETYINNAVFKSNETMLRIANDLVNTGVCSNVKIMARNTHDIYSSKNCKK